MNYDSLLLLVFFPREGGRGGSLSFDAKPEAWGGEHDLETTDVRPLEMRGEGLSGARLGMLCGRGCRRDISMGLSM